MHAKCRPTELLNSQATHNRLLLRLPGYIREVIYAVNKIVPTLFKRNIKLIHKFGKKRSFEIVFGGLLNTNPHQIRRPSTGTTIRNEQVEH